jgi:hypothetical protein
MDLYGGNKDGQNTLITTGVNHNQQDVSLQIGELDADTFNVMVTEGSRLPFDPAAEDEDNWPIDDSDFEDDSDQCDPLQTLPEMSLIWANECIL